MKIRLLKLQNPSSSLAASAGSTATRSRNVDGMPSRYIPRVPEQRFRSLKQKYKLADLPLPEDAAYFETWRKTFMPSLLAWAGAHGDPFRISSELYTAVPHIWERVFPRLPLLDCDLLTVVKVVSRIG